MSAHGTSTCQAWRKGLAALTMSSAGIWFAVMATAAPATALEPPEPRSEAGSVATMPTQGPPNYPNYDPRYEVSPAKQGNGSVPTMPTQGPPNYPSYDPRYEVKPVNQGNGLDTTSVALGALCGIALAGAGLGITLGVQRRREHSAPHTA